MHTGFFLKKQCNVQQDNYAVFHHCDKGGQPPTFLKKSIVKVWRLEGWGNESRSFTIFENFMLHNQIEHELACNFSTFYRHTFLVVFNVVQNYLHISSDKLLKPAIDLIIFGELLWCVQKWLKSKKLDFFNFQNTVIINE